MRSTVGDSGWKFLGLAAVLPALLGVGALELDSRWSQEKMRRLQHAAQLGVELGSLLPDRADPLGEAEMRARAALDAGGLDGTASEVQARWFGSGEARMLEVSVRAPSNPFTARWATEAARATRPDPAEAPANNEVPTG